ncbi:MAG TPA: hypothetical protein PKC98_07065, partial [Candidatus Melainabacteria bacterium]|nr:hypothetical protein [Candidatus Melainabacteria bacterium]
EPVRSRIENEDKTSSESESESETGNGNGNGKASSEDKPSSPREEPEEQSTLLKEAYRLFEGPGSRQIG